MANKQERGSGMDITQSQQTWKGFLTLLKYSLAAILLIVALMAIFRVH